MAKSEHLLAIGKVILIDEHTHELIPRDGEISQKDIIDYIKFLRQHLRPPVKIVLHKLNSYSYTFAAQQSLANSPYKPIIAVLSANKSGRLAFEAMAESSKNWNYAFFESHADALTWLKAQ